MSYILTYKADFSREGEPRHDKIQSFSHTFNTKEEAEDAALEATIGDFGCTFYDFRINGEPADLKTAEDRDRAKQGGA